MFGLGCKHRWVVLDKTVLLSGYEQMMDGKRTPNNIKTGGMPLYQKAVQVIVQCKKCGKLREFVARNPYDPFLS